MEYNPNYPEYIEKIYSFIIPAAQIPERLDSYLTRSIHNATRTRIQKAIEAGNITVNGKISKASKKIQPFDSIICKIMKPPPIVLVPENIPLNIYFEDDFLIVVNKPAGMVSHPGFGNRYGTLINAILYHLGLRDSITIETHQEDEEENYDLDEVEEHINPCDIYASDLIRPGLVHRLDKDTSGLLVISKNSDIHAPLAKQFFDRTIERFYYALVWGNFENDTGIIEGNIGRSPRDRKLFAVVKNSGKEAKTEYNVIDRFEYLTLLKVKLWTGRTHQIRVHLSNLKHPVFGDVSYGGDKMLYSGHNPKIKNVLDKCLKLVNRQMLHAETLGFTHPITKETLVFHSELPDDYSNVLNYLKNNLSN